MACARLEAIKETITYQREKKKEHPNHPVRQPLPADLERREEIIEPDPILEGSKCMGEESNAGASLLSHLLVSKYQDHLPFYRQTEMFKRKGIILAQATVCGWFSSAVDLLEPLYGTLKKEVLSSDYISDR